MTMIDTDLILELWPLLPAIGSIITGLLLVAKKAWKNEATLNNLVEAVTGGEGQTDKGLVCMLAVLTKRVDTLTTQFGPFVELLNDSVSRMILGGIKGNPLDAIMLRKIKMGLATVEEIDAFDAEIAKEIETVGPDALPMTIVRYWLALKKAERRQ